MEKIRINAIDKKPSGLVIVKYQKPDQNETYEATLNTKWQSQEVDYLEKDVGVGGEVSVVIEQKGKYVNITNVDMTSAVKGTIVTEGTNMGKTPIPSLNQDRNNSIVCQCLLKIAGDDIPVEAGDDYGRIICERLQELVGAYKLGLTLLDE